MEGMDPKARLESVCRTAFAQLHPGGDEARQARLEMELAELTKLKGVPEYHLDHYDRKVRYADNEHNLFVEYLLGIAPDFDIASKPSFTTPEFPDQDIDYLVEIRDYLKNDYAPRVFGKDKCCSIGTYTTYGIKSSILDCTRIYEGDRDAAMKITKPMALKDEDGDVMTWESALDMYPEFKAWVEQNGEIAEAAQDMIYSRDVDWHKYGFKGEPPHRVRSTSSHAGGLVISSVPVALNVPLIRGKGGVPATAWAEGLHAQDLTLVGQVKFDLLVVDALEKIALAIKLIREEDPGFGKISAKPGGKHWSDRSYRNDPKCIEMANAGDLKGVFQFDSDGIRELAKFGGVTTFEDIVAYTSLYRPGPMDVGMHMTYCKRKRGEEEYEIHPLLEPVLKRSYGVMVYQEDVFRVLNIVGQIPLAECQGIIKAISKKNLAKVKGFQEAFIRNGQRTLGWSEAQMAEFWAAIESFAGYGFNRGHAVAYSNLSAQMLFLKAHYPVPFYTALMSCLKTADDRLPIYKRDAENHGVTIQEVDRNISRENFHARDGKIYWGFGKVKGIGEEMAGRIVANQPYEGLDDFLTRFGTEQNVVKPLVCLRVFNERDSHTLWRFYSQFKDAEGKRADAAKRWTKRQKELMAAISEKLGHDCTGLTPDAVAKIARGLGKDKEFAAWEKKYCRSHATVQANLDKPRLCWAAFDGDKCVAVDAVTETMLSDHYAAEEAYYGFVWRHPMRFLAGWDQTCTFDKHKVETAYGGSWPVDVELLKVSRCVSKKGNSYTQLEVQDADFRKERINVWEDDSKIFAEYLKAGNVLRMILAAPDGGFRTYQLESLPGPRWKRKKPDPQMAQYDCRVQLAGTMEEAKAAAEPHQPGIMPPNAVPE